MTDATAQDKLFAALEERHIPNFPQRCCWWGEHDTGSAARPCT